jgi:hypothetical protein
MERLERERDLLHAPIVQHKKFLHLEDLFWPVAAADDGTQSGKFLEKILLATLLKRTKKRIIQGKYKKDERKAQTGMIHREIGQGRRGRLE